MAVYNSSAEKFLFHRIADDDEPAFRQIFDLYKLKIFVFVHRFTHSQADAEEVVQDTFLSVWANRKCLGKVDHPRNYIYTIARNKTLDFLSKAARNEKAMKQIWANMQLEVNQTEDIISEKESRHLVSIALSQLSAQRQLIFKMSRNEGKSHEEIAVIVGLSKSRVKNIIVEVLKYIKVFIKQYSPVFAILAYSALAQNFEIFRSFPF